METRELSPERIVRLEDDAVVVLDQRRLPHDEVELRCRSAAEVADAIRVLAVRGAPAIGVAAAYGLALAAERGEDVDAAYEMLAGSRPTAVNLRWALDAMRADPTPERAARSTPTRSTAAARWARTRSSSSRTGTRVLTHCNTGGLATGGYGTALGAIRAAWEAGRVERVWVDETRPLLQGARLDRLGARAARDPARGDRRQRRRVAHGRRGGRPRRHRRRPHRRERRHGQQDRHVRARRGRTAPRAAARRRRADEHARPGDARRRRDPGRGA